MKVKGICDHHQAQYCATCSISSGEEVWHCTECRRENGTVEQYACNQS